MHRADLESTTTLRSAEQTAIVARTGCFRQTPLARLALREKLRHQPSCREERLWLTSPACLAARRIDTWGGPDHTASDERGHLQSPGRRPQRAGCAARTGTQQRLRGDRPMSPIRLTQRPGSTSGGTAWLRPSNHTWTGALENYHDRHWGSTRSRRAKFLRRASGIRLITTITSQAIEPCVPSCAGSTSRRRMSFSTTGQAKGRAVILAAEYPLRRVMGIEIDPQLHDIAIRNLERPTQAGMQRGGIRAGQRHGV